MSAPDRGPVWASIVDLYNAIEDAEQRRRDAWAANWRGRLDGATLNHVMRLRHQGQLPHTVHLMAGPGCIERLRRREAAQRALPGGRVVPVGSALYDLGSVDIIPADIGDRWELRHGPYWPDEPGEVLAQGTALA